MTPLIDATEMYLRTVWELEEEGITPIRARLVERLGLSAPAVSETVHRLEEEGLLRVNDDRTLSLTDHGAQIAVSVMRKHRLAELLLTEVIGLEWEQVHNEACRWEHVISDAVEERLVELLKDPTTCPHGNPIPGAPPGDQPARVRTVAEAAKDGARVVVCRISEKLQGDVDAMRFLREHGIRPGTHLDLTLERGQVIAGLDGRRVTLPPDAAELVYVAA
ncbi:MAG TPA: metal-dependent transcriptional regulator [Egibacteraceae bacterium]|nr:metal-dependent transcriptional regulator [Egibacteraceae bacterium]